MTKRTAVGTGALAGFVAYVMWGVFPLYWPLLQPAGAIEILAHRVVQSLIFLLIVNAIRRSWSDLKAVVANRRAMKLLAMAAVLVTLNWGIFIWAVNDKHVVETSLGYFINPLVSMTLGVLVFRERMRPAQWTAFGIATFAVAFLTWDYGRLPWIALGLAGTFAAYGLMKKLANAESISSLTIETAYLTPFFLGYLIWLEATGRASFPYQGGVHATLMIASGLVTAIPLLLFNAAATRIPLTTLGVLQYVGPTMQFLIGIFVNHEPLPRERLIGFIIVWTALVIFTVDAFRNSQRRRSDSLAVEEPS